MAPAKLPLVFILDIEPGPHHDVKGLRSEWDDFAPCVARIDRWRPVIGDLTGAAPHFSWAHRVDAQIEGAYGLPTWAIDTFRAETDTLRALGDAFGIHTHAYRWDEVAGRWFQDYFDLGWLADGVGRWVAAYEAALGEKPAFFRFGDHWFHDAVLDVVEAAGIDIDLTLEPGRPGGAAIEPDRGAYTDCRLGPRLPYRPGRGACLESAEEDARNLWVMPLSTGCVADPEGCTGEDHPGHQVQQINLNLNEAWVHCLIDQALTSDHLVTMVGRTGDLADIVYYDNFWANWRYLWGHPAIERFVIRTPAEALAHHIGQRD